MGETKKGLPVCGQMPSINFYRTDYYSKTIISTGEDALRKKLPQCGVAPETIPKSSKAPTPPPTTPLGKEPEPEPETEQPKVSSGLRNGVMTIVAILIAIVA